MPKRPQTYHRPTDLQQALALLAKPGARPLAGGTALLADEVAADSVVDLQALGLDGLHFDGAQWRIGATCRLQNLAEAAPEGGPAHLMQQAIYAAGPNTFRNAATLGGLIASRPAASELLALLLVLEAQLSLLSLHEGQTLPLSDYLAAPTPPPGLISQIALPWEAGRGALRRVARTPADAPIVAVAAWRVADGPVKLAASGIGPRPMRLPEADFDLEEAIRAGQAQMQHPGDFLGSADYRREMLGVLMRRAILASVQEE
jgi:probable selenate reductase FAD-binding subunit